MADLIPTRRQRIAAWSRRRQALVAREKAYIALENLVFDYGEVAVRDAVRKLRLG